MANARFVCCTIPNVDRDTPSDTSALQRLDFSSYLTGKTTGELGMTDDTNAISAIDEPTARIVIVDDHPLFRGAMRQALSSGLDLGMGTAGPVAILEAGNFRELQKLLSEETDIDLVLLDLAMPGVSGFSGLMTLRSEYAAIPVVIVSASDDSVTVARALDLGASGFVPKSAPMETIREAITAVMEGDVWKPADLDLAAEGDPEIADLMTRLQTLTPQQSRVLSMISQGLLNKQIAYELSVSEATVKAHVSAVLSKLNVDSRTQAVIQISKLGAGAISTE
ncbi:glycerol metabolism activator [Ahrensia sp. R2A130]|nr:glycerol metabolism activator [Ahrensia sp. R2A130]